MRDKKDETKDYQNSIVFEVTDGQLQFAKNKIALSIPQFLHAIKLQ